MTSFRQRWSTLARDVSVVAWVGFSLVAAFSGFVALMLIGDLVADPGGWRAAGLIAAFVVPLVGLAALAFYWPAVAVRILAVLSLLPVGFGLWELLDYETVRAWEDTHGPVALALVVILGAALAIAGLSRPLASGVLMVVVTVVPLVLAMVGAGSDWFRPLSIGLVSLPILIGGVLFLVAGRQRVEGHLGGPPALVRH